MNNLFLWLAAVSVLFACSKPAGPVLFEPVPARTSGITFANRLAETEHLNILTYEYFYNGGGVAAGDFNNDGLTDLYFTGNQVDNRLYLNQGEWRFEDVTAAAGVAGRPGGWKTGVSLADVNADGWLDIYVCYSGNLPSHSRRNQLFINNGTKTPAAGPPAATFTERAADYGLADAGYSTQAAFLDYDADGDLDCFVMNHNLKDYERDPSAAVMRARRDDNAGDKLFRNDQGRFVEVTQAAGIKSNPLGFGLGLAVADVNADGLPDIYVGNDYVEDDYLYINQGGGRYADALRTALDHTSRFTMGVDIADVNNDARPDIFTLDMLPADNLRQKLLAYPDNWNNYQSMLRNGFWHQNMRNMLHINEGKVGSGLSFCETGRAAGISATDWSWAALLADYDNDGWKDLFVTNGELKDFTNSDFIRYTADQALKASAGQAHEPLLEQIRKMPSSATHAGLFRNLDGHSFADKASEWGLADPAVANGAVCADLDNDGDLDLVTNNNNAQARLYRNTCRSQTANTPPDDANYLKIKLKGPASNPWGVQAKVYVKAGSWQQYQEFSPVRGFQSSVCEPLHFGTGRTAGPLQVRVVWPDGTESQQPSVSANQTLVISHASAKPVISPEKEPEASWFVADTVSLRYVHRENPTNDFARQLLLPYQYSYTGTRMAVGDFNADGLDDIYLGGAAGQRKQLYLQERGGTFRRTAPPAFAADSVFEDKDAVFFDADNDHDLDLYVVSGDFAQPPNSPFQQDRFYRNKGGGDLVRDTAALPAETLNGSCVKVLDANQDGSPDLFVGGSVVPGRFPASEPSRLLLNDGKGRFKTARSLMLGLVADAVVLPAKAGLAGLVVAGEWMPPRHVAFGKDVPAVTDLPVRTAAGQARLLNGWWNRLAAADLDGDGDADLVLGNVGANTPVPVSADEPVRLHTADFDGNGTPDPVLSYYLGGKEYPAVSRDELLEQLAPLRRTFTTYQSYAEATLEDLFPEPQRRAATVFRMDFPQTCVLENTPTGFVVHSLPLPAQLAPVYALALSDLDYDGRTDLVLGGNQSQYHLRIGKMEANHGMVFCNRGGFRFEYVPQAVSGLHVRGDVKDIRAVDGLWVFLVNNASAQVYRLGPKWNRPVP